MDGTNGGNWCLSVIFLFFGHCLPTRVSVAELAHGRFYALGTFNLWRGGYPGPDRKVDKVELRVWTDKAAAGLQLVLRKVVSQAKPLLRVRASDCRCFGEFLVFV